MTTPQPFEFLTPHPSICHVDDAPALPAELQVKLADVLTVSIQTFCAYSFQQKECGSITSEDVKPLLECWRARQFPTSPLGRSVWGHRGKHHLSKQAMASGTEDREVHVRIAVAEQQLLDCSQLIRCRLCCRRGCVSVLSYILLVNSSDF